MTDPFAQPKARVRAYLHARDTAPPGSLAAALAPHIGPACTWALSRPLASPDVPLTGAEAFAAAWEPLRAALAACTRDEQIRFAGVFRGETWVTCYGVLNGTFANPFHGIAPTGGPVSLRYGEFYQVHDGVIVRVYAIYDVIGLMEQAGIFVLPRSAGSGALPPPATGDGVPDLMPDLAHDPAEGEASFNLVHQMLFEGLNRFDQTDKTSMGMTRFWKPDMRWYGPAAIGTCIGLGEFERFHQMPFLHAFPDRVCTAQEALIGEGAYTAASGCPGVVGTHTGEYLGHPATGRRIRMFVMDWWRREGDLLAENWVLIDLIDIFAQFGVDLMARARAHVNTDHSEVHG
jgi:predicted ester cyclase